MNRTSTGAHLLLVEGIPASGKSTLIDALVREHVAHAPIRRIGTLVSLTQNHTGGPLVPAEDAGTLTKEETVTHLETVGRHVSWLVEAAAQGGMPQPFIVIDTLHITHCVRRELEWEDVAQLDATLAHLWGKLVLLTISPETLWRRLFEGQERAAFRDGYARRFGDSPEAIYRYFLQEQERMQNLCDASAMQTWVVDADRPVTEYVSIIRELWNGESADESCEQPGRLAPDRGDR